MLSLRLSTLVLIGLLSLTAVNAQVNVSVRDTSARPVDTMLVPIDLSGLSAGDSVFAVQAKVSTGTSALRVVGIQTTGTLSDGANATYFQATSTFALAFTTPVTADGVLVYLEVVVQAPGGNTYTVALSELQVNEGTPTATAVNGSIYIRYIQIQPQTPSGIVVGDTVQFSTSGNVVQPLMWSSTAPSIGTIDSTGQFVALTQGVLQIQVIDGEGKSDATSQFTVNPENLRTLTVSVPDTSQVQTLDIMLPVRVSDVTGLNLVAAQFLLSYSTTYLEYVGASTSGTLAASWGTPTVNPIVPGNLQVAMAGTSPLSGAGTLLYLTFRVKAAGITSSPLTLSQVEFNEGIQASSVNGSFTPLSAPSITAVPERLSALKGEVVSLLSTSGGTAPYAYSSSDPSIASVDPLTGQISVLTRGPVRVLVSDALGFQGSSDTIRTYDFEATLPVLGILQSDSVDIPLTVGNTTGLGISSYEIGLTYDTSVVTFRTAISGGTLSDGFTVDVRDSAGHVVIAAAGAVPLSGSGSLVSLRFASSGAAAVGDSSDLTMTSVKFNEPSPATPLARRVSGRIGITVPNTPPVFTTIPGDTAIAEGSSLVLTFSATDSEGDSLTYTLLLGPSGGTVHQTTGVYTFSPTYDDSGSYVVWVGVSDGLGIDSASVVVTVLNVNRAPAFTQVLPDTTLTEGDTLRFTYAGDDPDGDAVFFRLIEGPAGSQIDSVSGQFAFAADFAGAGSYTVRVLVSDGDTGDTTTAALTVTDVNRPPAFVTVLDPDTVIAGETVSGTYAANDPDGDLVWYVLIQGPAAAQLDSASGSLMWLTAESDTGSNVIRVIATDGNLADTAETMIFVHPTGTTTAADPISGIPEKFSLSQNYPNPFNPSTRITFSIPGRAQVRLEVFNVLGQLVAVLQDGPAEAGWYSVEWNPHSPSGTYLYRLVAIPEDGAPRYVSVRRMIFTK